MQSGRVMICQNLLLQEAASPYTNVPQCCTREPEHGLEFPEDVIHKGTVNQTQASLQNLTV